MVMLTLNLLMKLVWEQMLICGSALTQCPFRQFGQELRKAALTPAIEPGHCITQHYRGILHLPNGIRIWSPFSFLIRG